MHLLYLGMTLWWGAHVLKRVSPELRQFMGKVMGAKVARGLISAILLASVVLMYLGYHQADMVVVYTPIAGIGYLTDLLMLPAVFLAGAGSVKGVVAAKIRHPMLWSVLVWAGAHLLVNGDMTSIVLFGGLGAWAIVQMLLINGREGPWQRPEPGPIAKDRKLAIISVVLYIAFAGAHYFFGHNPFLGTY